MSKIIFTVTNDLNFDQRMIRICSTLQNAGYEVVLVGRKRSKSTKLIPKVFQQKRLNCYFEKGKLFYLEFNIRLFFYLLFSKSTAICAIDLDTLLPAFLICKLKRTPCIYDAHEYYTEVPELVDRPAVKRVWESLANVVIPRLKFCYTVGPQLASILSQKYQTEFQCIRNVPESFNYHLQVDRPYPQNYILYQGALNMGRGISQVIAAMKYVDDLHLLLAGEGDLSQVLRDQARMEGLEGRVKFLGMLPPEDLIPYTKHAFIGLNVLENKGLSYYYSLSNKTFDYIQAGIPSIQMAFPEYQALNSQFECSYLVDDLVPNTIAKAIYTLQTDIELYQKLQNNCIRAAEKLNWENEMKILLNFYKEVLPSH